MIRLARISHEGALGTAVLVGDGELPQAVADEIECYAREHGLTAMHVIEEAESAQLASGRAN